jgi:hypothetical protein
VVEEKESKVQAKTIKVTAACYHLPVFFKNYFAVISSTINIK